jgi:predicted transcriptional regulator
MKKKITNLNGTDIQVFSNNLQRSVLATGLTPYALAKNIGVDKDSIKNLMKGDRDPQFSTVISIVKGMRLSMDELLGIVPALPAPKVEVKKENINFIEKITKMNEQDVELLDSIAGVLDERRVRAVTRLLHAVQGTELPNKKEKEGLMAEAEKITSKKVTKPLSGFDDADFEDNEDFEDDDYEEDEDFGENDDFDDGFEDDDDFDFEDDD